MSITVYFLNRSSTTVSYSVYPYLSSITTLSPGESDSDSVSSTNAYCRISRNGTIMSVNTEQWTGTGTIDLYPYRETADGGFLSITFSDDSSSSGGGGGGSSTSTANYYIYSYYIEDDRTVEEGTVSGIPRETYISYPGAKTGYTYVGCYSDTSLSRAVNPAYYDTTATTVRLPIASYKYIVFFYKKNVTTHTITYNANGGTNAPGQQTFYSNNLKVTISKDTPKKTGHNFLGWSISSSANSVNYEAGATPTLEAKDYILYAVWQKKTYAIKYDDNVSLETITVPDDDTKTYGIDLTLSKTPPERTGYTFTGWNTISDGTGTSYQPGEKYSSNAKATLYAQWKVNSYTLTYNVNANDASGAPEVQSANYKSSWSVDTKTIPMKTGYIFKGWSEDPGSIHPTYWREGSYTITVPADHKIIYAVWWPDFSWNDGETKTNANKFIEYLETYYANGSDLTNSIKLNETNGIIFKKEWYNIICQILWGLIGQEDYILPDDSTRIVSKTSMKILEDRYRNYKGEQIE